MFGKRIFLAVALVVICVARLDWATGQSLPIVAPESVGLDSLRLGKIAALVEGGIAEQKMPGCVVCVGRGGKIAYLEAFGSRQVQPEVLPMTTDTVFDLASLTKPIATATSVMKLVEDGQLRLNDSVADYFPDFGVNGKDEITILDLLVHQSGLIPDNSLADYLEGSEVAWQRICGLKLISAVGEKFKYSDVNFIVLAKLVQKVSGQSIDEFTKVNIFAPLKMRETGFCPSAELVLRSAVTQQRDGQWIQGQVHDPRAFALGGVAGHAGLFSTANDLAVFGQMLLDQGKRDFEDGQSVQVLSPATVQRMRRPVQVSSGSRCLGWDHLTGFSSNRGDLLSDQAFGHGGFTGTVFWVDPKLDLFYIFLSNRVHPDGSGSINPLAGRIANVIASSVRENLDGSDAEAAELAVPVLSGIDVLQQSNFRQVKGQRLGLITNHTGRNVEGIATSVLLAQAKGVQLKVLFSPEHGAAGQLDRANVPDGMDSETGLPILSLYGDTKQPTAKMLADIDTVVFDVQDIGCRFYTYVSTMGLAMQAAAEQGKKFVVLDRPNPIDGVTIAGPMRDAGRKSFVAFHDLPVRHGMTLGELATMFKAELDLELELTVIPCQGWKPSQCWDQTGQTRINPSPNMRNLNQALLYPGIGMLEMTGLSVGRGTDTPFEMLGAPWIDQQSFAIQLNGLSLPGVTFIPVQFTPHSSKFAEQRCGGVQILITDRKAIQSTSVGLGIAVVLRRLYPNDWDTKGLDVLMVNKATKDGILQQKSLSEVKAISMGGVNDFKRRRRSFLLYPRN